MIRIAIGLMLCAVWAALIVIGLVNAAAGRTTLLRVGMGAAVVGAVTLAPGVLLLRSGTRARKRRADLVRSHPELSRAKALVRQRVAVLAVAELGAALIGFVIGQSISSLPFAGIAGAVIAGFVVSLILIVPLSKV